MIFKGFTDVDGNVIPVQGAGTVYNEEKNSLALGKETSAIGQDQLVFGRYNEEDANKAEIVGGGETVDVTTVDYLQWGNYSDRKFYPSDFTKVTSATELKAYLDALFEDHNVLLTTIGGDKWSDGKTLAPIETYPNKDLWVSAKLLGPNRSLQDYLVIIDINPSLVKKEKEAYIYTLPISYSGRNWNDVEEWDLEVDRHNGVYLTPYRTQSSISNHTNIRTLDWQGNQWNAGDITCDDGNGNTISMRDLLSRIATLEAVANS